MASKSCFKGVLRAISTILAVLGSLYLFVCSLTLLSRGFRLLFGSELSRLFSSSTLLSNPLVGVMIGLLATALVQSSSTSTSIIVSLVSAGVNVRTAIPIIMGSNVGTSVTNTIVALMQMQQGLGRAFAAATVHDMFNFMAVLVLLPFEMITQTLEKSTEFAVDFILPENNTNNNTNNGPDLLGPITRPLTDIIVVLDNDVLVGWSFEDPQYANTSSMLVNCSSSPLPSAGCPSLLSSLRQLGLSDSLLGLLLSLASLGLLCVCLITLMRVLNAALSNHMSAIVHSTLNADLPFCPFLTGYLLMFIGALVTIVVRSSSVFTSTLTPLCGSGLIDVETIYPLTLGSNLGTTTTALLAALAAEGQYLRASIQIALVHLFFNVFAIILFYPLPLMRWPVMTAKKLGKITASYRWFALLYLFSAFFMLPLLVFLLSLISVTAVVIAVLSVILLALVVLGLRLLQSHKRSRRLLPKFLRNFQFLPLWMRSLEPWDECFANKCCCCLVFKRDNEDNNEMGDMADKGEQEGQAFIETSNDDNEEHNGRGNLSQKDVESGK